MDRLHKHLKRVVVTYALEYGAGAHRTGIGEFKDLANAHRLGNLEAWV